MENIVNNYLYEIQTLQEIEIISEDIASFIKKFDPRNIKWFGSDLKAASQSKNPDALMKVFNRLKAPKVPIDKIVGAGKKLSGDFKKDYELSKRVLDNSLPPETSDNLKKAGAFYVAVHAIGGSVKVALKRFVEMIRYISKVVARKFAEIPEGNRLDTVLGLVVIFLIVDLALYVGYTILTTFSFWNALLILLGIYLVGIVTVSVGREVHRIYKDVKKTQHQMGGLPGGGPQAPIY